MSTAPKPFVFVLMPFSNSFDDVYKLGIQTACHESGAYCERVDEQVFEGTIIDRVYNQIATARFVIADMSGRNPNVFYEVGYAHALNKKVILLTNNASDIPFDLSAYPHIIYTSITALKNELSRRIRSLVLEPETERTYFYFPLKCLINGKPLLDQNELPMPREGGTGKLVNNWVDLCFDIVNSAESNISKIRFRLGFICASHLRLGSVYRSSQRFSYPVISLLQEDERKFHLLDNDFELLPGGFETFNLDFYYDNNGFQLGQDIEFTIRILTDAGVFDRNLHFTLV